MIIVKIVIPVWLYTITAWTIVSLIFPYAVYA